MTDSMEGLPFLCVGILLVLIVYSFPVLISGWRKKMQSNAYVRLITIVVWSLILVLVGYGLLTGLTASMISVFGDPNAFATHMGTPIHNEAVGYELWRRQAFPSRLCYTTEQEICELADERMRNTESTPSVGSSFFLLAISFLLTLPSSFILLYFSRPKRDSLIDP